MSEWYRRDGNRTKAPRWCRWFRYPVPYPRGQIITDMGGSESRALISSRTQLITVPYGASTVPYRSRIHDFNTVNQCFGFVLISIRILIRIQHFRSIRIRIRLRIQIFSWSKWKKKIFGNFSIYFLSVTYCFNTLIEDFQAQVKTIRPSAKSNDNVNDFLKPTLCWFTWIKTKFRNMIIYRYW